MGTRIFEFEKRTRTSHTEAFSHIMKHRRLLLAVVQRAKRILGHILEGPNFLISSPSKKLHDALATDAKDQTSCEVVHILPPAWIRKRKATGSREVKVHVRARLLPGTPKGVWERCALWGHHPPDRVGQSSVSLRTSQLARGYTKLPVPANEDTGRCPARTQMRWQDQCGRLQGPQPPRMMSWSTRRSWSMSVSD